MKAYRFKFFPTISVNGSAITTRVFGTTLPYTILTVPVPRRHSRLSKAGQKGIAAFKRGLTGRLQILCFTVPFAAHDSVFRCQLVSIISSSGFETNDILLTASSPARPFVGAPLYGVGMYLQKV